MGSKNERVEVRFGGKRRERVAFGYGYSAKKLIG